MLLSFRQRAREDHGEDEADSGAVEAGTGVGLAGQGVAAGRGVEPVRVAGLTLTTISNVFMAAAFGSAAFVQPGIGRAHLDGVGGMPELNADTAYGPALVATALTATLFLIVAAIVLGVAIARADRRLRLDGVAYAVLIAVFALSGFLLPPIQAWTGFAFAVAAAALAVRLPKVVADGD